MQVKLRIPRGQFRQSNKAPKAETVTDPSAAVTLGPTNFPTVWGHYRHFKNPPRNQPDTYSLVSSLFLSSPIIIIFFFRQPRKKKEEEGKTLATAATEAMDFGSGMELSYLQKQRVQYRPELPPCLQVALHFSSIFFMVFFFSFHFLVFIFYNIFVSFCIVVSLFV